MPTDTVTQKKINSWELETDINITCWILHAIKGNKKARKTYTGVTVEMILAHFKLVGRKVNITSETITRICVNLRSNNILCERTSKVSNVMVTGYDFTFSEW